MLLASAQKLRRGRRRALDLSRQHRPPSNRSHRDRSPVPWLHIAEEVASVAAERGFRRLLILGTRYLMEGPVYPAKLRSSAIECEIPPADERIHINAVIFDGCAYGRFEKSARANFSRVIARQEPPGSRRRCSGARRSHCSWAMPLPCGRWILLVSWHEPPCAKQ